MRKIGIKKLTSCALIAAIYVVLSLLLAPITFGAVQFRASEALALLPVISPYGIIAVTVGCFITNVAGVGMGITMPTDIIFGTLATFIAACITYFLRGFRIKGVAVFSAIAPVVVNAIVIGWEINTFFLTGDAAVGFWAVALSVGIGELAACFGLGLPLLYMLKKTKLDVKIFE